MTKLPCYMNGDEYAKLIETREAEGYYKGSAGWSMRMMDQDTQKLIAAHGRMIDWKFEVFEVGCSRGVEPTLEAAQKAANKCREYSYIVHVDTKERYEWGGPVSG